MKAIFSVYVISPVTGRRLFHSSYTTKSYALKKARSLVDLGDCKCNCVVVKRIPFGEDLAVFEV